MTIKGWYRRNDDGEIKSFEFTACSYGVEPDIDVVNEECMICDNRRFCYRIDTSNGEYGMIVICKECLARLDPDKVGPKIFRNQM